MAWFLEANPQCTFITAYHDREYDQFYRDLIPNLCSAEYDISGMLRRWGLRASMIERGDVLLDSRTVEAVKEQRPEDDPEEWPEDLSRAPIFLIKIDLAK